MPKANNRDRCLYEDPPGTWWVRIYDPTTGRRIRRKAGSKTLARETGLRAGNLFGLRREDVDLGQALLRVPETKHGAHHDLPLTARAVDIFGQLLAAHESPWVFPSPRNAARPRNYDASGASNLRTDSRSRSGARCA